MPDLLQLDSEDVPAVTKKYGTYTIVQNSPHQLLIKSGNTTICSAQTPQDKKWTVQVVVNIIEENA